MSPEQAVGQPVDKRSDLWAFGVVVLEMLTSRRVFTGETVPDVLLDFPFALATGGVQHGLVILVGEVRRKQADPSSCSTGSRT
jgi:serine/threonine protein kinase